MRISRRSVWLVAGLCAAAIWIAACSSDSTNSDREKSGETVKDAPVPITLKVMNGLFNERDWQTIIVTPMKKKFPHITLDQGAGVAPTYDLKVLEQTIASGNTPDIVLSGIFQASLLAPLGLAKDLTPWMKKNKVTFDDIDSMTADTIKSRSPLFGMETATLPLYINFKVMLYNKDLFEKFAVPYPKNHMTHEEAVELSKKLTRMDGGVQYYGYQADAWVNLAGQLSLTLIDKKTSKANTNGFERVFQLLQSAMSVPGMKEVKGTKSFNSEQTLAMNLEWLGTVVANASVYKNMNWGMVTMPEFKEKPGVATEIDFHSAYMTKTVKHPDEAFQVISWMMQSEEIQSLLTRSGKVSVLTNKEIRSQWGKDSGLGTEEALKAIAETKLAPALDLHPLERRGDVQTAMHKAYEAHRNGTKDVNVALRDAAEEINRIIQTEQGK